MITRCEAMRSLCNLYDAIFVGRSSGSDRVRLHGCADGEVDCKQSLGRDVGAAKTGKGRASFGGRRHAVDVGYALDWPAVRKEAAESGQRRDDPEIGGVRADEAVGGPAVRTQRLGTIRSFPKGPM